MNFVTQVVTILAFFLIAMVVQSKELGQYAILSATAAILASFTSLSIENSLLKLKADDFVKISETLLLMAQVIVPILVVSLLVLVYSEVRFFVFVGVMTLNLLGKKTANCINIVKADLNRIYINNLILSSPPLLALLFYYFVDASLAGFLAALAISFSVLTVRYLISSFKDIQLVWPEAAFTFRNMAHRLIGVKDYVLFNTGSNIVQSLSLNVMTIILGYKFGAELSASYSLANRGLIVTASVIAAVTSHSLQVEYRASKLTRHKLDRTLLILVVTGISIAALATLYTLFVHDYLFSTKYVGFSTMVYALFPALLATLAFSSIAGLLTIMQRNYVIFMQKLFYLASISALYFIGVEPVPLVASLGLISLLTGILVYIDVRRQIQ